MTETPQAGDQLVVTKVPEAQDGFPTPPPIADFPQSQMNQD
ncbi:hypothetical protein ANRL3_02823 [Anaerolineae bacterium]|nr:hypothetical protein ANRL3_02823 [Anaerolineae bacterium]